MGGVTQELNSLDVVSSHQVPRGDGAVVGVPLFTSVLEVLNVARNIRQGCDPPISYGDCHDIVSIPIIPILNVGGADEVGGVTQELDRLDVVLCHQISHNHCVRVGVPTVADILEVEGVGNKFALGHLTRGGIVCHNIASGFQRQEPHGSHEQCVRPIAVEVCASGVDYHGVLVLTGGASPVPDSHCIGSLGVVTRLEPDCHCVSLLGHVGCVSTNGGRRVSLRHQTCLITHSAGIGRLAGSPCVKPDGGGVAPLIQTTCKGTDGNRARPLTLTPRDGTDGDRVL